MAEDPQQTQNQTRHSTLKIWQQNVNNSKTAHLDLLNMVDPNQYHVIAIQEPYTDQFGISRGNRKWEAIYPPTHATDPKQTRSMLLISTRIPSDRVQPVMVNSRDISAVRLQTKEGPITIYNIYNDCQHSDAIDCLDKHLHRNEQEHSKLENNDNMIWVGDFNRHHPMWDELRNKHLFTTTNLEAAERLIDSTILFDMEMALPPGQATLKSFSTGNRTRTDNVFCSNQLSSAILKCKALPHY